MLAWHPLPELYDAFPGDGRAQQRTAQRWAARLVKMGQALREGKTYRVSSGARFDDSALQAAAGLTVEALLRAGPKAETLAGCRVPEQFLENATEKDRSQVLGKRRLVTRFDELKRQYPRFKDGQLAALLAREMGAQAQEWGLRTSARTIARYRRALQTGDGLRDMRGRTDGQKAERSPEAWKLFWSLYGTEHGLELTQCWRFVAGEAREHGWSWPALSTIRQQVENIPKPVQVLAREGESVFDAACLPKIPRSYEEIAAGEWWCLDGRKLDFMAREPDARGGWRRCRLVLTGVLDSRSRKFVGWHISPVEHSDAILAGVRMAILDSGAPRHLTHDCGEAYRAAIQDGVDAICSQFGITAHRSLPYWAWSKQIESIWNHVKEGFCKFFASYWGGRPDERPENADRETRERIDQLPTLKDVRTAFEEFLKAYHATPQNGDGMNGLTPNLAWEQYRGEVRAVDPGLVELLCTRLVGPVTVGRDGVRYRNLLYGHFDEALWPLQGRSVMLRVDPSRADFVTVCDEKGTPICRATNDRIRGASQEDVRRAARLRAKMKRAAKEALPARQFILETPTGQIMAMKARHAQAAEAELRKSLPAPPTPQTVRIARPELEEAAKRIARQETRRALQRPAAAGAGRFTVDEIAGGGPGPAAVPAPQDSLMSAFLNGAGEDEAPCTDAREPLFDFFGRDADEPSKQAAG